MLELGKKLRNLQKEGKYIKIALAGTGQMGSGLISQLRELAGMQIVAVVNRNVNRLINTLKELEIDDSEFMVVGAA